MLKGAACPRWSDDSAEHELPAFDKAVRTVWLQACIEAKNKRPGCKDLRQWHVRAFRDVVPLSYYAGNFRQRDPLKACLAHDVAVNTPAGPLPGAPFREVPDLMANFERDLHEQLEATESDWQQRTPEETLKRVALVVGFAVAHFIRIHPFMNGNGRTSRMLWGVLLARLGLPVPMAVVKRPGPPYGDVMQAAMRGDNGPAVLLVLAGIVNMTAPAQFPA
jgi:fido (protein-threonine AMPylation protein)